jgi:uncharacterized protein with von Willebrand factor type A (vWA) domain
MTGEAFRARTLGLDLPALAVGFGRRLHAAGVPAGAERAARLAEALALVRPVSRRRLYWTARAVHVSDAGQLPAFDAVFAEVFGARDDEAPLGPDDLRRAAAPPDDRPVQEGGPTPRGSAGERSAAAGAAPGAGRAREPERDVVVPTLASAEEVLRRRSFDALAPSELAEVHRLMAALRIAPPERVTRRARRDRRGPRIDLRRTLRGSLRTAGDPIRLARRRRRVVRRRLVMVLDISGSMEPYARAYLQFLASAAAAGIEAEAFVFATRLTRVTRALRAGNPRRALERAAAAAPDWSSGTRIGEALRTFNDRHGRRGMARGAVVVILSDGWERGDPALVGREMARLSRLAYRIVWVNPRGTAAQAPWRPPPVPPPDDGDDEPWASATPVAGSSVAMPSGYGPSRGRTTPGWT